MYSMLGEFSCQKAHNISFCINWSRLTTLFLGERLSDILAPATGSPYTPNSPWLSSGTWAQQPLDCNKEKICSSDALRWSKLGLCFAFYHSSISPEWLLRRIMKGGCDLSQIWSLSPNYNTIYQTGIQLKTVWCLERRFTNAKKVNELTSLSKSWKPCKMTLKTYAFISCQILKHAKWTAQELRVNKLIITGRYIFEECPGDAYDG